MRPSRTARYVALYRALETDERRREPLFRDPLAEAFLSRRLRFILGLARHRALRGLLERYADYRAPGARSSAICRTRFIDDIVRRELGAGARQLVVLGAGFDCRAHRMPELADAAVFEVDRPETQVGKRATVERLFARQVTYVAIDFGRDDLGVRLVASGWNAAERTIFLFEGVTNYLTEPAVAAVLEFVGRAAPESVLVFTYLHGGVLDGSVRFEGAEKILANVRRLGEPWTFGIDPAGVAGFVGRHGLRLEEDLGADEYRTRCGWAAGARGYAFYRLAVTRVARP